MPKLNPFVPNSPITPGMFIGRLAELERLEECLLQTRVGEAAHFMVTGERGIGKSSLLRFLRWQALGEIDVEGEKLKFLVVDVDLDRSTTQLGLIRRIQLAIEKELERSEPARTFLSKAWDFIKRCEAAGVKVRDGDKPVEEELLLDELAYSLAETASRLKGTEFESTSFSASYDGVLILIDEADSGAKALHLGTFVKRLTEKLQKRECGNVAIGLAGLPELRTVLAESHASAPRALREIALGRLSRDEVEQVIARCLEWAEQKYHVTVAIEDDARALLVSLSEGYPHFVQQFGFSAYARDSDNRIDRDDVLDGAFDPGGALQTIGDNYYRDSFYIKIQEESYRQVLRIMADQLDGWVTKQEIAKRFKGKQTSLDNAIAALRERKIIIPREGARGVYRLQHKGFAMWIKWQRTAPEELEKETATKAHGSEGH